MQAKSIGAVQSSLRSISVTYVVVIMSKSVDNANQNAPLTISEYDSRDNNAWVWSFSAAMVPFVAFCYGHQRGVTGRVVERMVKSPIGVYGLFLLPFATLGMEKCIYDSVQSWQGIDPKIRPKDRGGFPSGGVDLPSFSLIPVQKRIARSDD